MADKKNGKKEETDGVKELKASDLDAEELQQEIEKQAQAGSQTEEVTERKTASKSTQNEKGGEKAAVKDDKKDDTGTPIIVRRNNSYLNRSSGSNDSEDATKPLTEDKKVIKPPSATSKVVAAPEKEEKPIVDKDTRKTSGTNETADKQAEKPAGEETERQTPTEPPKDTEKQEAPRTPTQAPTTNDVQTPPLGNQIDKMKGGPSATGEKQQKPTVFDTTQYHLPIKPRNTNYVNNAVAWTILVLVLTVVGGYVMYRLGVLDLSRFGL